MNGEACAPFRRQKKARWQAGSSFQAINTQIMNALIPTVNPVTMSSLGLVDYKVTTVSRSDGTEKIVEQVLVTAKGLAKLAEAAA